VTTDDTPPGEPLPVGLALPEPLDPAALQRIGGRPVGAVAEPGAGPRFDGDTSELPPEACWALQELIAAPHVLEQTRGSWAALLKYEDQLRSEPAGEEGPADDSQPESEDSDD
jgi:hypothetical protein